MRRTQRLWHAAAGCGDLVILPYVREDTPLAKVLPHAGLWQAIDFPAPAPYVARADHDDWAAYQRALSGSVRHKIRRVRRRLAERGDFALCIEPVDGRADLIDWILEQKKRWLVREGMQSDFIGWPDYRDFLVDMAGQSGPDRGLLLFTLKLDGVPIAGQVAAVNDRRFEAMIGVYAPEWSHFSPGRILTEHCLQWSFEHGIDFDLRVGEESYKHDWASRVCNTFTWYVATGLRGMPVVLERRRTVGWRQLKTRLATWKNELKKDWLHKAPPLKKAGVLGQRLVS
jgi:CelD/BcsL family acetyltransferase involved in cellulose biosynthesis